ncbi:ABC transporter permease [Paradevosia shaoguanensis]|uniref:ABC transporter permease n=1 Tax=Paradevosia shaoguanensis TaxID=1335043 RepID=UPI001931B7A3|nr:ABC transporter permease [Paradevosia shaoguanensis]
MKLYFARKFLMLPLVLLGVSLLVFLAIRALPGDPARLMAGPEATQEAVDNMRIRLGLERSLIEQYVSFLWNALHGDFGISIQSKLPVTHEIAERFPYTLALALCAYGLATLVGVPAGVVAATHKGGWPDQIVMLVAIAGASIANFWLALMSMNLFSVQLGWLPLLGASSWKHFIMPTFALGLLPTAIIARMTRSSMVEVLSQDYVRTARAKGLSDAVVHRKHALRNALIPIVTIIGLNFGSVLGGAVVTESVFNWPGIGRLLVDSVSYRDYPMIQALILLAVVCVVVINFLADVIIAALNPRIRFD